MAEYSLLFPGQGSQFVGMGKDLYAKYAAAKEIFDDSDDILGMLFLAFVSKARLRN